MTTGVNPAVEEERRWVERFLAHRDEAAFRALYRAHSVFLYRLAVRLCAGRRDAAEDALQEAWLRAAQALPRFRWESRLRTWLAGFVVNCCREERRRSGSADRGAASVTGAADETTRLDLEAALFALPNPLREVLVLHVIEGYTHEEIGALLGIAAGTSKSRLFDARHALRRQLAGHGGAAS